MTNNQAIFAAGCFWGIEEKFLTTDGVIDTEVGYTGGITSNPTYHDVCAGDTGHAEAVRVKYDNKIITYDNLVHMFFDMHNPTTLNRQGPDVGTQYRSEIFCLSDEQYLVADSIRRKLNTEVFQNRIVTKISKVSKFWIAEEYHQKYIRKKKRMII